MIDELNNELKSTKEEHRNLQNKYILKTNEFDELKEKFQKFSFQNLKSESERKGNSLFPLHIYIYIYIYTYYIVCIED